MYADYCFDYSPINILQVTPAFFNDIHFYGQSSRKWSLENAASSSASKRVGSKINSSSTTTSTSTNGNSTSNTTSIFGSSTSSTSSTGSNTSSAESSTSNAVSSICSAGNNTISEKTLLEPSNEEQEKFFAILNQASETPAILRIVLLYAKDLAPTVTLLSFPKLISEL